MTNETYDPPTRKVDDRNVWIAFPIARIVYEPAVQGKLPEMVGGRKWNRPAYAIVMTESGSCFYFEGEEAEALKDHPIRGGRD